MNKISCEAIDKICRAKFLLHLHADLKDELSKLCCTHGGEVYDIQIDKINKLIDKIEAF